jgi:ferredoxin-NADP reductase
VLYSTLIRKKTPLAGLSATRKKDMIEFNSEVTDVIRRTHNVKSFRFKVNEGVEFKAGQFFFVTIDINGEEQRKPFSFSSSPTEKGYVEFTKRITESEFSEALDGIEPGAKAKLQMPYGKFTLEENKKIAFLSGGIGITPIRSMFKYATDNKLPVDMVLLYGNNTEEDIVFKEDFDQMQGANDNLRVIYTLTDSDVCPAPGTCKTGRIDACMIKEEIPDFDERVFYLCGPPGMVACLTETLKEELKLTEGCVRTEQFVGY